MTFKQCKGFCNTVKRMRPSYDNKKYCSTCTYYTTVNDKYCFCCGTQMRITPADKNLPKKRNEKSKKK